MNETEMSMENELPKESPYDKVERWLDKIFVSFVLFCGVAGTTFVFSWIKSPTWNLNNWIISILCHSIAFIVGAIVGFAIFLIGVWLLEKICNLIFGND